MLEVTPAGLIAAARRLDQIEIAGLREALGEIKYVLHERRPRNGPRPYDFNERAAAWRIASDALKESDAARQREPGGSPR